MNYKITRVVRSILNFSALLFAVIFLLPAILGFLNSFKSNAEIQMNIASLPMISLKVPERMEQSYFDGMIINRIIEQADKDLFVSSYTLQQGKYVLKKGYDTEKKLLSSQYDIMFPQEISKLTFNMNMMQRITDYGHKEIISKIYRYEDGVYIIKKGIVNTTAETKLLGIIKKYSLFKTFYENFKINYSASWEKTKFPVVLFNTFFITLLSTAGIILVSSMAAYALVRFNFKYSFLIFLLFTFAMVVPFQAIMFPLVKTAKMFNLLGTFQGIILIYIGVGCPMAIFMYHGFIKGVPKELEESASIDGANQFTIFFKIVFPLLQPVTATIIILNVLWLWNDFLLPLIITLKNIVTLQLAQYYTRGAYSRDMGMELSSLVLASLPVVIFYVLMQKFIIKGITAGAVKG